LPSSIPLIPISTNATGLSRAANRGGRGRLDRGRGTDVRALSSRGVRGRPGHRRGTNRGVEGRAYFNPGDSGQLGRCSGNGLVVVDSVSSNRGRRASNRGADRGRGASRNSASTGQVRDAEATAATDRAEIRQLGNAKTFSPFYVPFLRSVFKVDNNLTDRRVLHLVLQRFWPAESVLNLDDSILLISSIWELVPGYNDIKNLLIPMYYFSDVMQEYLLFSFDKNGDALPAVIKDLEEYYLESNADVNIRQIKVVSYYLTLAINHFQLAFKNNPDSIMF
jgi:hypothetical protein